MSDKVDFLGGQVKALINFAIVLIHTHPNAARLKEDYEAADLAGLGLVEGQSVSDAFVEGFQEVQKIMNDAVTEAAQQAAKDAYI